MSRLNSQCILLLVLGIVGLTGCPLNTPASPALSKIIVGSWDTHGLPVQFNSDGTFSGGDLGADAEGTYEIVGNAILLKRDEDDVALNMYYFVGVKDGNPVLSGILPLSILTPAQP